MKNDHKWPTIQEHNGTRVWPDPIPRPYQVDDRLKRIMKTSHVKPRGDGEILKVSDLVYLDGVGTKNG